jgi:hypothetical protein
MLIGVFVRFETVHAFGNEGCVACGQPMHFIIESSAFGEEGARRKKANGTLSTPTYCSHANRLSLSAQMIHRPAQPLAELPMPGDGIAVGDQVDTWVGATRYK